MRTSFEPQSFLHQFPVTDIPGSTVNSCTPVPFCTYPDHLTTTHSLNATRARLRHASAPLVTSCEVSVSVFCSLSWSLCSQCVTRTVRSESSRGVSMETHFILVTLGSFRLLTELVVVWGRVVVEYFGPRDLVLESTDLTNVNKEVKYSKV